MTQRGIYRICLIYVLFSAYSPQVQAQRNNPYWQQEIRYKMDVRLDVQTNRFSGSQQIKYTNNSPETLDKVFFHLYLNAFQPGSAMDVRSQTLSNPDPRIGSELSRLTPEEIGYQEIISLTQDGVPVKYEVAGTILEVKLAKPVKPGKSVKFEMAYEAQVPVQIRRTGRDNAEGIRYSMSQWYPKLCEYDDKGWHAHPYIAREFYGVWGDFDVSLTLDADYTVAASGQLVNANKIGHGYADSQASTDGLLTWHFIAENVHDFVWAADPDYVHDKHTCADGVALHAFYVPHEQFTENWQALLPIMEEALTYINTHFGKYPYPVYSFIQGGDGGMEYPMATLITGHRSLTSLVGVSVHELIHSWYQMILGFNENYYYWMDEGFTNYASQRVMEHLRSRGLIPGTPNPKPFESMYKGYANLIQSGIEEPLSTHADHFNNNTAYGIAAYNKGAVFLHQLEYVVGKSAFDKGMLDFFQTWKFKHPDDNDFIRVMENVSGLELDWYKDYMVYSIKTIDFAVDTIIGGGSGSTILLRRDGLMPMPVDIVVKLTSGNVLSYTVPLDIMRGAKAEADAEGKPLNVLPDWDWVNPYYLLEIPFPADQILTIAIDPSMRMADVNTENNQWPRSKS
jgi:hypothetical protein